MKRKLVLIGVFAVLLLALSAAASAQDSTWVSASSSGNGSAAAFAQTAGNFAITNTATFGNGVAGAWAYTPGYQAWSWGMSNGFAASYAQSMSSPVGTTTYVQVASSSPGTASASSGAWR